MTTMRKLITASLRSINAVQANEEPTDADVDIALRSLNGLVDSMSNELLNIHTFSPYRFPLTAGQKQYTLGPALDTEGNLTNADWVIPRPMRIEQAKVILYGSVVPTADGNIGYGETTVDPCAPLTVDTFTGTGTLATHVGEIGATWIAIPTDSLGSGFFPGAGTLADVILTGSGAITTDVEAAETPPAIYPSGCANLDDTFVLTMEFSVVAPGVGPYTGILGNLTTGEAYVFNWLATNSYFEIGVFYMDAAGSLDNLGFLSTGSINNLGTQTLTVVSNGATKTLSLNGTDFIFTDNRITQGVPFLYLNDFSNGEISSFTATPCAPPVL